MTEKNQDETPDTGESGETYDQEMEANRVLPINAENAKMHACVQYIDSFGQDLSGTARSVLLFVRLSTTVLY